MSFNPLVATKMYLTNGVGEHKEKLQSFELALRDAGIANVNLVMVSSILPPKCKIIPRSQGEKLLHPGQITYVVLARSESNEARRMLSSSIGIAIPQEESAFGYLSEHHSYGETARESGDYAEDLAAAMLASTLGVEFDEDQSWDEKRQIWKISGKIVKTRNVTQSAVVKTGNRWTTTVAAAVLLFD